MKKGYLKSAHLDRRDHLISGIYYPITKINKGGNLQLCGFDKNDDFRCISLKKNLKIIKNYSITKIPVYFFFKCSLGLSRGK